MSFYRTYRPQVIEEIDNKSVKEALLRLLSKEKKDLPHAFLFAGPRGSGKTTAARLIAKLFNCTKPVKTGPCGICEQCISIAEGKNLDVFEIDAASNRGIDEIRTLRDGINLSPVSAAYKIYIIDEVHMLTTEAFNALLKTLEEPPAHAVFVLATTDPQKVPVTIKSRCITISFAKATPAELISALTRIVDKEKIPIERDGLDLIVRNVDGAFRDAVKYLEQVSFHKGNITPDIVRSILSVSEEQTRDVFLDHLAGKDVKHAIADISVLVAAGKDIKSFLTDCLCDLELLLVAFIEGKPVPGWNPSDLRFAIRKLSQAYSEMKGSAIAQLPLELAVVEYCSQEDTRQAAPAHSTREEKSHAPAPSAVSSVQIVTAPAHASAGLLTFEKLVEHWPDVIAELKPYNHSVAGVMRSTRPKSLEGGIVTIEAFYTFHKDKLSETKTREVISDVLKKLFGEKVKVDIVLGKK